MRRIFWLALGLGAGAVGAIFTLRFARKQVRKVAPSSRARAARGGLLDLSSRLSESLAEGQKAMKEKEEELRAENRG